MSLSKERLKSLWIKRRLAHFYYSPKTGVGAKKEYTVTLWHSIAWHWIEAAWWDTAHIHWSLPLSEMGVEKYFLDVFSSLTLNKEQWSRHPQAWHSTGWWYRDDKEITLSHIEKTELLLKLSWFETTIHLFLYYQKTMPLQFVNEIQSATVAIAFNH